MIMIGKLWIKIMTIFKMGQTIKLDKSRPEWVHYAFLADRLLCFLFEHKPQKHHCTVIDLASGKITTMLDPNYFRAATEEEC